MTLELATGFSSCPNDTFMFHGLVFGDVPLAGLRVAPVIADIEALNLRALGHGPGDPLPVTKLSASAVGRLSERYTVLAAGAALGRGCGPLVVTPAARPLEGLAQLAGRRVAIPGEHTTAHLLLRTCFAAAAGSEAHFEAQVMRFDEIMPALAAGRFDAGLIIHESRFTYADHGLVALADLGQLWEAETGLPLPLGMICASRELDEATIDAVEHGLRRSIELAFAEPERSRAWIREHAQELDAQICQRHIELYVNDYSVDLGDEGRHAIDELLARGRAAGFLPPGPTVWR